MTRKGDLIAMCLAGTFALMFCLGVQSAEPQQSDWVVFRKKSDAFANSAFLYADTTRVPVALRKEAIDSFLVSYGSIRRVKDRIEAERFAKGPQRIPDSIEPHIKEMIISKAEIVGGDLKALLSAQGVFLIGERLFFWEQLSHDSLFVIPQDGQPILFQK